MNREELITLPAFLTLLQEAHLLSAYDLARARRQSSQEDYQDPGVLAWWLVEQNLVTRWQAHMLVSGWNHFFLGKYKLLDRVGAGGMGTVYKALQPGLARVVALKVLSDALLQDEHAVARFHREIQSVAALEHPNIVATFDADCVKGKHFLVMEYVAGQDLDALLRKRGRLAADEACEYIRQAALGLAHAHGRGMIHRDIKPANLLVAFPATPDDPPPIVKILDFGLARFGAEIHAGAELTQTGQVMGTPDYIAPEQARDTKSADHRSDIFSLGCTLFRLVTGQVPFRGTTVMEKLMSRALEEAPRARSRCPELHPALDECIARMLARDPARRFQSADDVALALGALASEEGMQALPELPAGGPAAIAAPQRDLPGSGSFERIGPLESVDSEMAEFLAVLADEAKGDSGSDVAATEPTHVSTAAPGAAATFVDRPRNKSSSAVREPRAGAHRFQTASAGTRKIPYAALAVSAIALVGLAAFIFSQMSAGTRLDIEWPEDERKGATLEVDGRERAPAGQLSYSGGAGVRRLRLTRKGYQPIEKEILLERGATVTFRPEWVPTPATARRRDLAALKSEIERIKAASGGNFPAFGDPARAALENQFDDFRRKWFATTEAPQADALRRSLPAPADLLSQAAIPAYERRLSGIGNGSGNGGKVEPSQPLSELVAVIGDSRLKHSAFIWSIAYSPDETLLAAGDEAGYVKIWDPETGEEIHSVKAHEQAVYSLAFSPDGQKLLTGSIDNLAKIWHVATMHTQHTLGEHTNQVRSVAYSPLGDLVATAALDQTVKLWDPANGKLVRTIARPAGNVPCIAFSPDGRLLAVGCHDPHNAFLYDVEQGTLLRPLEGEANVVSALTFSPDGKTLVTGSADAWIRTWQTANGKELRSVQATPPFAISAVRFTSDGRTIAVGIADGTVEFRDAESCTIQQKLRCDDFTVTTMATSLSGRRVTTAGSNQVIRIWDRESDKETVTPASRILSVAASPDGRNLALGARGGSTDLWDFATRKKTASLQGSTRRVASLTYSPDGAWLATAGDQSESKIWIWDLSSREPLHVLNVDHGFVFDVAFSPDVSTFASAGDYGTARVWNLKTAALTATLDGKVGSVRCLAYSHDGRMLATGHGRRGPGGIVKVWDLARERELKSFDEQSGEITAIAFSRDDKFVTAGSPRVGVRLWDISRGTERMSFSSNGPFAYSPDSSLLAVAEGPAIHVYNTVHSDRTAEMSLGRSDLWATQLVFTADGRHIAALASNGTVHILRLPSQSD